VSPAELALEALEVNHKQPGPETLTRAVASVLGLRASVAPSDWPQLERLAEQLRRGEATAEQIWKGLARGLGELELPRLAHRVQPEGAEQPRISRALGRALEERAQGHDRLAKELRGEAAKLLKGRMVAPTVIQAAARATGAAEAHEAFACELRELIEHSRRQPAPKEAPEAHKRPEAGPVPIDTSTEEPT
jgi:hypothetical protein